MKTTDLQHAQELLRKAEQEKVEKCSREIEATLAKYECTMQPQVIIRGGQIIPQVLIVPISQNQRSAQRMPALQPRSLGQELEEEELAEK